MSLGLLFPGQGSQHAGMFDGFVKDQSAILDIIRKTVGADPAELSPDAMHRNVTAQALIAGHEVAAVAALQPFLPGNYLVLGYSVGEIAACAAAGMLDADAAIRLAASRAAIMDSVASPGTGMLAVRGLPLDRIREIADEAGVEVAIENGPDHAVLGGADSALSGAAAVASAAGARTVRHLPVSISSHTVHMATAAAPFRELLETSLGRDPQHIMISGMSARPLRTRVDVADSLARQLHTRLRFADALRMARECGATCFLEVGPGQSLTQIVADVLPDVPVRPLEAFRTCEGAGAWIERYA